MNAGFAAQRRRQTGNAARVQDHQGLGAMQGVNRFLADMNIVMQIGSGQDNT